MLKFLYEGHYETPTDDHNKLHFHAKMYNVGCKYCIKLLQTFAETQFGASLDERKLSTRQLFDELPKIFDAVPKSDATLRQPLARVFATEYRNYFKSSRDESHEFHGIALKQLQRATRSDQEFAAELVATLCFPIRDTYDQRMGWGTCGTCGKHREDVSDYDGTRQCKMCFLDRLQEQWKDFGKPL